MRNSLFVLFVLFSVACGGPGGTSPSGEGGAGGSGAADAGAPSQAPGGAAGTGGGPGAGSGGTATGGTGGTEPLDPQEVFGLEAVCDGLGCCHGEGSPSPFSTETAGAEYWWDCRYSDVILADQHKGDGFSLWSASSGASINVTFNHVVSVEGVTCPEGLVPYVAADYVSMLDDVFGFTAYGASCTEGMFCSVLCALY